MGIPPHRALRARRIIALGATDEFLRGSFACPRGGATVPAICGRYTLSTGAEALYDAFDWLERLNEAALDPATSEALAKKRYNVAPTQEVPIVGQRDPEHAPKLAVFRWGLLPFWAKSPRDGARMLNARVETLHSKNAFAKAFERRRCLVPADGWIEWEREGKEKKPFHIQRADGAPLLFAGLWSRWRPEGDESDDWLHTFTVVTRDSAGPVADLHPRMPVVVDAADRARWLIPSGTDPRPAILEAPLPELELHRVSQRVNDARNDDAACLAPPEAQEQR